MTSIPFGGLKRVRRAEVGEDYMDLVEMTSIPFGGLKRRSRARWPLRLLGVEMTSIPFGGLKLTVLTSCQMGPPGVQVEMTSIPFGGLKRIASLPRIIYAEWK